MRDCVCCSPDSVESKRIGILKLQTSNKSCSLRPSLICRNCRRGQYLDCVILFMERIEDVIPKEVYLGNQWYRQVRALDLSSGRHQFIDLGVCCVFGSTFIESTLSKPKPTVVSSVSSNNTQRFGRSVDSSVFVNGDYDISISSISDMSMDSPNDGTRNDETADPSKTRKLKKMKNHFMDSSSIDFSVDHCSFLEKYHPEDGSAPFCSYKYNQKKVLAKRQKADKSSSITMNNRYSGAIYFLPFQLLCQNQTSNFNLSIHIHAVAKSAVDGTEGVCHAVIGPSNANSFSEYMRGRRHKALEKSDRVVQRRDTLYDVLLVHDLSLTRDWNVQFFFIKQTANLAATLQKRKGEQFFSNEELESCLFIGNNQVCNNVDVTIVIGVLDLEKRNVPKLLMMTYHSTLARSISSSDAQLLYESLRSVTGKHGYEMNRVGGSSGLTSSQSDDNFRAVLHDVPSALPRRAGACLIMCARLVYYCIYSKKMRRKGKHPIAVCVYSSPQCGGSLKLSSKCIANFKIVEEFTWLKTQAVMILNHINQINISLDLSPIAYGPVMHELEKIKHAREVYSLVGKSMLSFLCAFNDFNSASLVTTNVGVHNDTFHQCVESLENKVLFTIPRESISGRGGSLHRRNGTKDIVVALLDWDSTTRANRRFVDRYNNALQGGIHQFPANACLTQGRINHINGDAVLGPVYRCFIRQQPAIDARERRDHQRDRKQRHCINR